MEIASNFLAFFSFISHDGTERYAQISWRWRTHFLCHLLFQTKELECDGIIDNVGRLFYCLAFSDQPEYFILVLTWRNPFIQTAAYLTLKPPYAPFLLRRLNLIETAGISKPVRKFPSRSNLCQIYSSFTSRTYNRGIIGQKFPQFGIRTYKR